MYKTRYIITFSNEIQKEIKADLLKIGLTKEDIENALSSRLCDLEDTINIQKYLNIETFNDLEIGFSINYDIVLKNGELKNETSLILKKSNNVLKIVSNNKTWYLSKELFKQLKNITVYM